VQLEKKNMQNKQLLESLLSFYESEKNIFLAIVSIGVVSVIIGWLFYYYTVNYKVFGIALLVIGLLEVGVFSYSLVAQKKNITAKVLQIESNKDSFLQAEKQSLTKMGNAYFLIKLFYAGLIALSVIIISCSTNTTIKGILTALIIHLAFAITIDNFAE
jgi:hypothetical protein